MLNKSNCCKAELQISRACKALYNRRVSNVNLIRLAASRTCSCGRNLVVRCRQDAAATTADASKSATQIRAEVTKRIKQLGRQNKPREAVLQLAEMAKLGVQPDTQAATALIDACARNGDMNMAQSVFDELFDNFLQPDDITFSVLVKGYGECDPPQWSTISGLLNMMSRKYNVEPGVVIYNTLLEICARTNDEERGYEIISRMEVQGVWPDAYTSEAVKNRKSLRSFLRKTFNNASSSIDE